MTITTHDVTTYTYDVFNRKLSRSHSYSSPCSINRCWMIVYKKSDIKTLRFGVS
jgi:hypothetical protein